MWGYIICLIVKVVIGSFAIGAYRAVSDVKYDIFASIIFAIISAVCTVICMGITIWQFS